MTGFRAVSTPMTTDYYQYLPATLVIHECSRDLDLNSDIESFWAGEPIGVGRVKEGLKILSQQRSFPNLRAPHVADLPPQRLRFATELIKGAGYKGWVVLLDELEWVGYYNLLQRAKSYAELARWLGKTPDEQYPGLIVVGTATPGLESLILGQFGKSDSSVAPSRLRERNEPDLAARAEAGIQVLEREMVSLCPLSEEDSKDTIEKLRVIYAKAYNWDAPEPTSALGGATYNRNSIRFKVRACINEWDLRRLYPDSHPETEGQGSSIATKSCRSLSKKSRTTNRTVSKLPSRDG